MYTNIQQFYHHTGITPMKERWVGQCWRLADQTVGHLRGCPNLRGIASATDGVLLLVQLESGEVVKGHLDNWIPDESIKPSTKRPASRSGAGENDTNSASSTKKASARIWVMLTE